MATSDLICNGPMTKQHLEEILQKYFKTDINLIKAEGVVISDNLGFSSDIIRVTLEWAVKDGLPVRIIAKVPKCENIAKLNAEFGDVKQHDDLLPIIHANECKAYEVLAGDRPIPIPKIYGSCSAGKDHFGFIVMEDMGSKAMVIDLATGLNVNQWRSVVENIADLNAWSLTTETPWKEKVPDMNTMAKINIAFYNTLANSGSLKVCKEKYPEYFGHVDEEKVLQETDFDVMLKKHFLYQKFMPDVIQQGDTWINNMMFEKNSDGTCGDKVAAFIDWQLCVQGMGLNDLAKVESFCINNEIRRENRGDMVKIYYDRVKSKAGDKLTASFDQIKYLHDEASALNGLFGTFLADFIVQTFVETKDKNEHDWGRKEMLTRMKGAYDDSAAYYGWTTSGIKK